MNVTVQIPDDLAQRLIAEGDDMERRALEGLVAEEYRAGRLTHPDVRRMLGFATHYELDGFLKARGLFDPYDLEDLEKDRADLAPRVLILARGRRYGTAELSGADRSDRAASKTR